jgi:hypothetical protein
LTKPLQFDRMNDALSRATSEVNALRERYDKLRDLVAERLPKSSHAGKPSVRSSNNHLNCSSQAQASVAEQGFGSSSDISRLSEYQTKTILTVSLWDLFVVMLTSKFIRD